MALKADDLWLKIMSIKNQTTVVGIAGEFTRPFGIPIKIKNDVRLMDSNIGDRKNDIIFNALMHHYKIPISIFKDQQVLNNHL